MNDQILGIDLGTTNSVASVWNGLKYTIIKNNDSNLFPSIIEFTEKGKIICNNNFNNNNCIKNIKRFIGQDLDKINLLNFLSDLNFNYKIIDNKIKIYNKYEDKFYFLEELNSLILKFIVNEANKQLNINITDIVITIPTHFNQIQRNSVLLSIKLAKLNCIRMINEPTAASLAYGLNIHNDVNILVFDLGGGTLDLSMLNIDDGIYEVLSTQGDNLLGGEDFTKLILEDVILEFKEKYGSLFKLSNLIEKNMLDLKSECEKFKCNMIDKIFIKDFYVDGEIKLDLVYSKKRDEICNLFKKLFDRIESHLSTVISSSNLKNNEIDYLVMVGGSTKMIEINNFIKINFSKSKIVSNIDPDLVVSIGAAIQGYILKNPDDLFSKNIALVDVLPLSIGVESDNGLMTKIIKKNIKLPFKHKKIFTNEFDYQEEVDIKIFQGERALAKDNIMIGNFKLSNLQKRKRGKNIICIEISVNNNCMVEVTANEKNTDNKNNLIIQKKDILFDEKMINDMILEGDKYDEIDNLKYKLHKSLNKLKFELNNLEYNYNNDFIFIDKVEKDNLLNHINRLKLKMDEIIPYLKKYDLNNDQYLELIQKVKKLLKVNNKKYPMLTQIYDNEKNKDIVDNKIINLELEQSSKELNDKLNNLINRNINSLNKLSTISKYTKKNIISFLQNKSYKLESINLDNELFEININEIQSLIEIYLKEDNNLINNFGNINMIKNILSKNNIQYDISKFYNLDSIQIFDLLFDICQQFNIKIN
jgi:molecular chaperone DnaK (HSP70)